MVVKDFFTGLIVFLIYKMGLTGEDFDTVYKQREMACSFCPLRDGAFCSKKKSVRIVDDEFLTTIFLNGRIRGCGCFLPFKRATNSVCPMGRWTIFK